MKKTLSASIAFLVFFVVIASAMIPAAADLLPDPYPGPSNPFPPESLFICAVLALVCLAVLLSVTYILTRILKKNERTIA